MAHSSVRGRYSTSSVYPISKVQIDQRFKSPTALRWLTNRSIFMISHCLHQLICIPKVFSQNRINDLFCRILFVKFWLLRIFWRNVWMKVSPLTHFLDICKQVLGNASSIELLGSMHSNPPQSSGQDWCSHPVAGTWRFASPVINVSEMSIIEHIF